MSKQLIINGKTYIESYDYSRKDYVYTDKKGNKYIYKKDGCGYNRHKWIFTCFYENKTIGENSLKNN